MFKAMLTLSVLLSAPAFGASVSATSSGEFTQKIDFTDSVNGEPVLRVTDSKKRDYTSYVQRLNADISWNSANCKHYIGDKIGFGSCAAMGTIPTEAKFVKLADIFPEAKLTEEIGQKTVLVYKTLQSPESDLPANAIQERAYIAFLPGEKDDPKTFCERTLGFGQHCMVEVSRNGITDGMRLWGKFNFKVFDTPMKSLGEALAVAKKCGTVTEPFVYPKIRADAKPSLYPKIEKGCPVPAGKGSAGHPQAPATTN